MSEAVACLANNSIWLLQCNCGYAHCQRDIIISQQLLCRTVEKVHMTQLLGRFDQVANARMHLLWWMIQIHLY